MECCVLGMAAFIHQCLWGFVVFADLIQLDTDNVGLPEVGAKSALSVVYVDHAKTSTSVGQHLYCQSTVQPRQANRSNLT
jgi:hypothetical protein